MDVRLHEEEIKLLVRLIEAVESLASGVNRISQNLDTIARIKDSEYRMENPRSHY